jgi:RNA polymerase sigma factor (sigma-70 family)
MTSGVRERGDTADLTSEPEFEAIYGQYHQFVRNTLRKHYVDPAELDDVTQEVFIVLLRRVDEVSRKRSFAAWLYELARRVAANHHRGSARRRRKHAELAVEEFASADVAPDPEDQCSRREAWGFIRDFLESLDEEACAVFVMSEIEGLRGAEIASRLGLSLPMTYARIRSVRARFGSAVSERRGAFALVATWGSPFRVAVTAMRIGWRLGLALSVLAMALVLLLAYRLIGDGAAESEPSIEIAAPHGADDDDRTGGNAWSAAVGRSDRDVTSLLRAALHGVVRDPASRPVAGAMVCAVTRSDEVSTSVQRQARCTTSRGDGRYELEGLHAVAYHVSASAAGHRPALYSNPKAPRSIGEEVRLRPGEIRSGVDIVLKAGGMSVRGVVKDLAGGPIAGAMVRVQEGAALHASEPFAGCVSDDEGAFECWSTPGEIVLFATAEDYTEVWERTVAPARAHELVLTPESVLVGRVVFAGTTAPIPNARITARVNDRLRRAVGQTTSDDDGSFRLPGLEPGAYKVEATTPELYGESAATVHLGLAETSAPILVEAHSAFFVQGKVVVDESEPCPSGRVELRDDERDAGASANIHPDGSVFLRALQPGEYLVSVLCDGYVSGEDYPTIAVTGSSVDDLVWRVSPGLTIRGEVLHADGSPVRGVRVLAQVKGSSSDPRAPTTTSFGHATNDDGAFEVSGLRPGTYVLKPVGTDLPPAQVEPEVQLEAHRDLDGVRIELAPTGTGTIVGNVHDDRGEPVVGAWVFAVGDKAGAARGQTNETGSFELSRVPPGSPRVFVKDRPPPGQTDEEASTRVSLRPGETVHSDLVVAARTGRIRGRVHDADGAPVSDAFVDVQKESHEAGRARRTMTWRERWRDPILTDVDGSFELDELDDGTYTLRAYRKGGGEGVLEGVVVGATVTVEIATPGVIEGFVAVKGGAPPERFSVRATDEATGVEHVDSFFHTDGQWSLSEVPAGIYQLEVEASAGTATGAVELAEGEQKTGVRLELIETVTVRGKLVDLETGAPVPGMRVRIATRSGVVSFGGPTSEDKKEISDMGGHFEIDRAPTGSVRLSVAAVGNSDYPRTMVPITIAEGTSTQELEPIRLVRDRLGSAERRGTVGLELSPRAPGEAVEERRLVVASVEPGGPSDTAGVVEGDEIFEVDGHDVRGANAYLFELLTAAPPAQVLDLTLGDERTVAVRLGAP